MKPSESHFLDIRGLRYHVRSWGRDGAPKLFMLHGWMDASASFQFFVDALQGDWHVLAPDLRGYGQTQWQGSDTYWFPDYVADVDRILDHFQPETPVNLAAHSFGGNIAAVYSGSMPHRIRRYVNIDAFGPRAEGVKPARLERLEEKKDEHAEVPPRRYADWLDRIKKGSKFRDFDDFAALEKRLQKEHPRVTPERIAFLARHWGRLREDGRVMMATDPGNAQNDGIHMSVRLDEAMACWRNITAPVLWLIAEDGSLRLRAKELAEGGAEKRLQHFLTRREVRLPDTGHMVHLEQPERLAGLVEGFMTEAS
jgi:pimeloyl-ACP methyl ester carboxylesterase